eukprot:Gb_09534 [translate_table: standard]
MAWFLIDGMYVSDLSYLAVFTVLDCLQSRLRSGIWKGDSPYNGLSTAEEVTKGIRGTSGIGKETVRVLGLRGARVVIGAINMEEGNRTKDELLKLHPDLALDVLELDLTSMASIYEFAANFNALNAPLNILMHNARGITFSPFGGRHRASLCNQLSGYQIAAYPLWRRLCVHQVDVGLRCHWSADTNAHLW